ncbi:HlyD family efflux transporter periplasmic adaptor subunit [Lutimaribacter sp. EGI FJ00015]|uniref:HlyD family efflux transporter periplasmic adaptor subunit n=1 Tax=Lutimaribacter degradans TaxID=2945989 RepID=A0ACC5ZTR6_9RHOB|nr:HlyD family efflux transporter periplasmic adaptor subunit [Lutimaribacter sp. EGI FJ00013]MCM2561565.1 HlyD family efflux transporter periplasmic adaptor subunit [Lutimaribacter sp. EGI FJ00013]MCO0612724.1 HlyD family efflux transporter periplasmic adaptor subunit [Lutimaribacter sp. EGI FJ00015]MCO0635382.1 HlyD family efflux transporter periplasmic adaptor subunit [Lutimaribacter sp. EGI FJ00014]
MRFLRQSLTGLMLLAVTLVVLVYAGVLVRDAVQDRMNASPQVPPQRERVFTVNVQTAVPRSVTPILTAFGEVQSLRTLELRAAASGTVIMLSDNFEEGARVEKGEVLLRIDPDNAQSALDRAESDLADAHAEQREAARALELARDELAAAQEQAALRERAFQRQKDLESRGVGTAAAVETAELAASSARQAVLTRRQALSQAEARVERAETALARARIVRDEARRRLNDTVMHAEFDGSLNEVNVVEGGLVSTNERLAELVDDTALEVALRVSTAQYARLLDDEGRLRPLPVTVTLSVMGVDLEATGVLKRDSAAVGEGQSGRLIFARLDRARGFKPGDFVTVRVSEPEIDNVVRLPATALAADGTVLVLGDDDRLAPLAVTLVRRQGDDVLLRGDGLAGREVVRERSPLLGEGIKVRPLRQDDQGADAAPALLDLSEERRARLVAYVEGDGSMTEAVKSTILDRLQQPRVPAQMVERLESRMGG